MSRFTDFFYRHWITQNNFLVPRRRSYTELVRGMGGMPPMSNAAPAPAPGYSRGAVAANDSSYSRPVKPAVLPEKDYVDNSKS